MSEQTANLIVAVVLGLALAKPIEYGYKLIRERMRFKRNCRNARKARGY